ncbi:ubiquitin-conjugating enzyme [Suillus subaureus]|uniref:Ubiquitin-conjugating enzyme n=1 Tax=Suillus subaureus TaxID=48587 RepID=A0A9P7EP26_9AGAM|nr:ubiquitin-conjugating enzyme [Suillus subaureus]KAG1826984.1 ubiquitin-conjugating enzyme [Suillus subaureus]
MTALRRIQKELQDITNRPLDGMTAEPEADNLLVWKCSVKGSPDSPYKNGTFHFKIELPMNFPFKAPSVTFLTKIYHPGINEEGHICVPILRDEVRPTFSSSAGIILVLFVVLAVIQEKVNNPSPDDPFEPEIAALLKNDKAKFLATAKEYTKR